jgi:3-oxoacyl-[acyl-carrier-protein] synthase III
MSHTAIVSIASTVPGQAYTTEELIAPLASHLSEKFAYRLTQLGIAKRHSMVENYPDWLAGRVEKHFLATTTSMGTDAAKQCIANVDCPPERIGLLIAMTNTSDELQPTFGCELIANLGGIVPNNINILNLQNEGCSALLKGVDIAKDYLATHPDKYALLVVSEAISAYFAPPPDRQCLDLSELSKLPPDTQKLKDSLTLISNVLFGDGAIAFLLGQSPDKRHSFGPIAHATNLEPEDKNLLTFDQGGILRLPSVGYPYYHMDKQVPARGVAYSKATIDELMSNEDSPIHHIGDASHYFIHTGSKKILDRVCEFFAIDPKSEAVQLSYDIFNRYANLSACAVGFMIEEQIKRSQSRPTLREEEVGLIISFGAGFTASSGFIYL